ncbi:transcription initiation factor TFIID subunit 5-like [Drosophila pseudoobscura]|uniref:Transcription initiation factor TFIID subunit 5-like n=1 Tax=Drosophila pseudoobscura pseudoobscura TaxID=46245 RepID=A0A6I8V982_DROPS|nr:transcription initiation factor TFIID subunit 5 [Drosophila pseudoobscura]
MSDIHPRPEAKEKAASGISASHRSEPTYAPQRVEVSGGSRPDETPTEAQQLSTFVAASDHHVEEVVLCVLISESVSLMAVGKADNLIHVFGLKLNSNGADADWIADGGFNLVGHEVPATHGAFSDDRQHLVTWAPDLVLRQWNLNSQKCTGIYANTHSHVSRILFEAHGLFFTTIDELGYAFIWMIADSGSSNELRYVDKNYYSHPLTACAFHPKITYLVTGSTDGMVRMWNMSIGTTAVRTFLGHKTPITALAFSICGYYLVAGATDGLLIVWNLKSQVLLRRLTHHSGAITSIGFSPNNGRLAVGSMDTQMSVWDFELLVRTTVAGRPSATEDMLVGTRASECGPIFEVKFVSDSHLMAICVDKREASAESEEDLFQCFVEMEAEESELEPEEDE